MDLVINFVIFALNNLPKKCQDETQVPFKLLHAFTGNISNKLHLEPQTIKSCSTSTHPKVSGPLFEFSWHGLEFLIESQSLK